MERKNKATANNPFNNFDRCSNCWFIEYFFVICCNYSVAFVTNLKYWMCDILHLVFEIWTCFSISERKYIDMLILRFVPKIYIMNQSWINQSLI